MANNSFAYIEKTLPKVIDKVFAQESLTDKLIGNSEIKLDFLDARTVKIFKLATTGLTSYARGGHGSTNSTGSALSTTETFTLSQERFSSIPLDRLDTLDDGETVFGHLATEFFRTKVVPEFDAYRFSKLAGYTSTTYGNRVSETISANTIISKFNEAFRWMAEQKVPESNQVIYVNPTVMQLIRNTTELARRLLPADLKDVKYTVEKYEGRPIIVVPSDEFYTDISVDNGYAPSSNSKIINFLVVDKSAPIIVKKLDWAKVYDSDQQDLGFVGYKFDNLYYHDLFVPENRKVGIYASVSTTSATAYGSAVLVNAVEGTTQGYTVVNDILTQPAGLIWDKLTVYTASGTAPAIGTALASAGTQIYLGIEFQPNATHNIICALYNDKVVAVSKDFEGNLPEKA